MVKEGDGKGKEGGKKSSGTVNVVDLETGRQKRLFKTRTPAKLSITADGNTLFAVTGRDLLLFYTDSADDDKRKPVELRHARDVVAVTCHPEGKFVAVGDERGEIFLWFNVLHDKSGVSDPPVCSKHNMHWHASAVRCMGISEDGAYLLSAGNEGVLVMWQLETGYRQFLPRLGGPVNAMAVSSCGTVVAVLCEEQNVQLVNLLTRKIVKTLRLLPIPSEGTKGGADDSSSFASILGIEPRHGHVLLNPRGTTLQIWDSVNGKHVQSLEVVNRNTISQAPIHAEYGKAKRPVDPNPRILQLAVSSDGEHLAVVHGPRPSQEDKGVEGDDSSAGAFFQLSFWRLTDGMFQALTRIVNPHNGRVGTLTFNPVNQSVVSAGFDGNFKLWTLSSRDLGMAPPSRSGKEAKAREALPTSTWKCTAVGSYRQVPCRASCFSPDGTLLAIAFYCNVTVWTSEPLELKKVLSHASVTEPIETLLFLPSSPSLVAASRFTVAVWNLLSCSLSWAFDVSSCGLVAHPSRPEFAFSVAADDVSFILRCNASSSVPSQVWKVPKTSKLFSPHGHGSSFLAYVWDAESGRDNAWLTVAGRGGFHRVDGEGREEEHKEREIMVEEEAGRASMFSLAFGAGKKGRKQRKQQRLLDASKKEDSSLTHDILSAPAHVLPQPTKLLHAFLMSVMPQQSSSESQPKEERKDKMDVDTPQLEERRGGEREEEDEDEEEIVQIPNTFDLPDIYNFSSLKV
uniref:WD repeat-containing protein 75 second beta-propeller domain-containing protein n=1 Tax=Guillardia theta TaxID=55529 RepID=A0A7S4PRJ2_GUITH